MKSNKMAYFTLFHFMLNKIDPIENKKNYTVSVSSNLNEERNNKIIFKFELFKDLISFSFGNIFFKEKS